jgi:uncharacterized protein YoxC
MFDNPLNLLYIVLATIILLIGILLAIALVYLIMILRDASKASFFVRDTAEKVNEFMYKPLMMATTIVENLKPILENLQEKGEGILKKKKKKK